MSRPRPRLPHLAPRPLGPGGGASPEKAERRRDGSSELRLRGPGPGRLAEPPGLGLGMAQPRPPAPQGRPRRGSLPAVAGWQVRTLAGAAWPTGDPRATPQPNYPESGKLCPSPITVDVCTFGLTPGPHGAPQSHGQFSTAARGTDVRTVAVGLQWHWVCVCDCCWDHLLPFLHGRGTDVAG